MKSWIMGLGRKALVLEPERLRLEIAEELQALLANYTLVNENTREQVVRGAGLHVASGPSSPADHRGR